MKEIVFAGSGGQGVLTAGLIISDIAAKEGLNVTWVPSYGSAMRGGTANCTVKYCENTIYNPSQEEPDVLLAMNNPSFKKFLPLEISTDQGNPKSANIVMTGAIVKLMGDFSKEAAITAMNHMFEKKGKSQFREANEKAFDAGYDAVEVMVQDSCVR